MRKYHQPDHSIRLHFDRDFQDRDFTEIYRSCLAAQDAFIDTANEFCTKRGLPGLDRTSIHSWEDVELSVLSACNILERLAQKDKEITPGFTGKMKAAFRSLCSHAGAGNILIDIIPTDSYCSVLCGGLKLIFTAMEKTNDYRHEIYTALEDIPYTLNDHAIMVHLNKEDEELHHRSSALYTSLFKLMNVLIAWFLRGSVGRRTLAISILLTYQSH